MGSRNPSITITLKRPKSPAENLIHAAKTRSPLRKVLGDEESSRFFAKKRRKKTSLTLGLGRDTANAHGRETRKFFGSFFKADSTI